MSISINSLPFELLSKILEEATLLNFHGTATFNYGLCAITEAGRDGQLQRTVRGHIVPDALRWRVTQSLRQVNRQWHDWASVYALGDLYITRWRGSERYVECPHQI